MWLLIHAGVGRHFDPLYIDPGVNICYNILTRVQYIVTIFCPPSRYFDPPLNSTQKSFVGYVQSSNVVYCCIYITFMNSVRIGVEEAYQNKMRG